MKIFDDLMASARELPAGAWFILYAVCVLYAVKKLDDWDLLEVLFDERHGMRPHKPKVAAKPVKPHSKQGYLVGQQRVRDRALAVASEADEKEKEEDDHAAAAISSTHAKRY